MSYKTKKSDITAEVRDATGQLIEGQLMFHFRRGAPLPDHTRMLVEGLEYLSQSGLGGADFALLCYLISRGNWDNEVWLNRIEAQSFTNILPTNQYKSLHTLVWKGLLVKGRKEGNRQIYLINPKIAFRGKSERYQVILRAICQQAGLVDVNGEVI